IVISFPIKERSEVFWTLNELLGVQVSLIWRGMLSRGAVVEGKVLHTDKMIFGPALVEAYDLESKAALFPRIILGDSLLEVAKRAPHVAAVKAGSCRLPEGDERKEAYASLPDL